MPTKIVLTEDEMPRQWYNMAADLPTPLAPPLGPPPGIHPPSGAF